jgi:hypothetical protein
MEDITINIPGFIKAVILPEESGVYKCTSQNTGKSFYILVEDSCPDDYRIKWLGEDGIYKFGSFPKYRTETNTNKEGVLVDVFNYSLSEAATRSKLISKDNQKKITLTKKSVPTDIFLMYMDLAKSVKVYLNVGDLITDKWIEVKVRWQPVFVSKKEMHDIVIELSLPEDYIQVL